MIFDCSMNPPKENYNCLSKNETTFFNEFEKKLIENGLNPENLHITRLSNNMFDISYSHSYSLYPIGGIYIYESDTTYAVIKPGSAKASRIFKTLNDINNFIEKHPTYNIEVRGITTSMQYNTGIYTVKTFINPSLQDCIDSIPEWIKYIKYCLNGNEII